MASLLSNNRFSNKLWDYTINYLLNRGIGPYIDGPLTVDSSGSPIQLTNLSLKSDVIERFSDDTPITIKAGYIGKILIHLPPIKDIILNPTANPVEIEIHEFRLLLTEANSGDASLKNGGQINAEYGRKRETALQDYMVVFLKHYVVFWGG